MTIVRPLDLYDDLLDVLADSVDASRLVSFHLSEPKQRRLDELLEKNREGKLSERDRAELATFEQIEHVVRLLKARVMQKRGL